MQTLDKVLKTSLGLVLVLFLIAVPREASAENTVGLFLNLSSLKTSRVGHAFTMADEALKTGHPVTIFLNHKSVFVATTGAPQASFRGQRLDKHLAELIAKGAKVLVCPMCMNAHGITEADIMDGTEHGTPDKVLKYLLDPNYKSMSW